MTAEDVHLAPLSTEALLLKKRTGFFRPVAGVGGSREVLRLYGVRALNLLAGVRLAVRPHHLGFFLKLALEDLNGICQQARTKQFGLALRSGLAPGCEGPEPAGAVGRFDELQLEKLVHVFGGVHLVQGLAVDVAAVDVNLTDSSKP